MTKPTEPWWRHAVIYEIYPRSFADANGDGEGDIAGIQSRLDYLVDLGVDAIWVAPWYPSPMADGGYDVTDYRDIHPLFGTLSDVVALIEAMHARGLRLIVDLVANHTSHAHPWFREALQGGPGAAARSRYIFRDGRGENGELPPNNWISAFGGTAWTRVVEPDGSPGQWYLHTFAPEQPDLDWQDDQVREDFDDILRFWLDLGVDGFRVDAAPAMGKDPTLPDASYPDEGVFASSEWVDIPHWDADAVHDVLRRWRRLIDTYPGDRVFVAEAVVNGPERLARYLRPDELHTAFNFDYVHASWDPKELREVVDTTLNALQPTGAPATWAMSSHDEVRHLTRLGRDAAWSPWDAEDVAPPTDLEVGTSRARAAILLTLALPGGAYLYQGEELGLPEVEDLPAHVRQDPVFHRSQGRSRGRDGCRVPLPWSGSAPPFGFSQPGASPWLPQPDDWARLTTERQLTQDGSMLSLYRQALQLRRRIGDLHTDSLSWLSSPDAVLAFGRGERFRCVVNLSTEPVVLDSMPILSSVDLGPDGLLPPDAGAWLLRDHEEVSSVGQSPASRTAVES